MSWKIALTFGERDGYRMDKLQSLVRTYGFEPFFFEHCFTEEKELVENLAEFDAVIAGGDHFTRSAFEKLSDRGKMKIVARFGMGYDGVDLAAASEYGIPVTNTPGTLSVPVAEMAMSLMLSAARKITACDRKLRQTGWFTDVCSTTLYGKTVGLVGFGGIAKQLARFLGGFNCRVLAHDIFFDVSAAEELGVRQATLEEIAKEADFISLHTPKTPETVGLWNKEMFRRMKPTAFLINTSRGEVVDQEALIWALENHVIAGAGLDVYRQEPLELDSPLMKMENVVLSPHTASWTEQTELTVGGRALENILDVKEGRIPRDILNPDYIKRVDCK